MVEPGRHFQPGAGVVSAATGFSGHVQNESGTALDGVYLYAHGASTVTSTWADTSGNFGYYSLPPGEYRLEVDTSYNAYHSDRYFRMYKPVWYDNKEYWSEANTITVTAGQMTSNINFILARRASIQGRVTDTNSGAPLSGFSISAQPEGTGNGDWVTTDTNGNFTLYVNHGTYRIYAAPGDQPYSPAYYNNKDYLGADLIPVTLGQIVTNINFRLTRFTAGSISGSVTMTDGPPLGNLHMYVSGSEGYKEVNTTASGLFSVTGLKPGWYRVAAVPSYMGQPYVDQYYCGQYDQQVAHQVQVIAGRETTNINFKLITGGSIRGQLRNTEGGPVAESRVVAYTISGAWMWRYATTDSTGNYEFNNLLPGAYVVNADTDNSSGDAQRYISQYFSNHQYKAQADLVNVANGMVVSNVDFVLSVGAQIAGQSYSAYGGTLYDRVAIFAWSNQREESYFGNNDMGAFTIRGLPPGTYTVQAGQVYSQYNPQIGYYYLDKLVRAEATTITITNTETISNITVRTAYPGKIYGRITGAGIGLDSVRVTALTTNGIVVASKHSDSSGYYLIDELLPGFYLVAVTPGTHNYDYNHSYVYQFYNGTRTLSNATVVEVAGGATTSGINVTLGTVTGRILGRVTRVADAQPVVDKRVDVELADGPGLAVTSAYTDTNGNYVAQGIPPGSYRVRVPDESGRHVNQYYSLTTNAAAATLVTVASGDVAGVNFALTEWPPYYVPMLVSPVCLTTGRPPAFVWTRVDDTLVYELQVNDVTSGSNEIIRVAGIIDTNYVPPAKLADSHQYEVRVRAGNTAGYGRWSAAVPFTQLPPPNYFLTLITNGPGAIFLDPPGGLYAEGSLVRLVAGSVSGSRFDTWTGAVSNRFETITWVIMDSNQTVAATFLPNHAPAQPMNMQPTNGSVAVSFGEALVASWFADPDSDAVHAATQWVVNRKAGGLVFDSGTNFVNHTNFPLAVAGLDGNTAYQWQVRYQDQHGLWSAWSVPTEFSTQNRLPATPSCFDPAPNSTNASLQPMLLSTSFADPDSMDTHAGTWVQVATATNLFDAAVFETNGPPTLAVPVPLGRLDYATYFWRVQYRDNHDAWSGWSAPARFTVNVTIDDIVQLPTGGIQLSWPTKVGWRYTLQESLNLTAGPWSNITNYIELPGTGGVVTYQGTSTTTNGVYYRIAAHPDS